MSLYSESPQFSAGGDAGGSNSLKMTPGSVVSEKEMMFSAGGGARLFQKEGEMARRAQDLSARAMDDGDWNADASNGIPIRDPSDGVEDEDDDERDDLEGVEDRLFQRNPNDDDHCNGGSSLHGRSEVLGQKTPDLLASHSSIGTESYNTQGEERAKNRAQFKREKRFDRSRGKGISFSTDSEECVRAHLSDPITGTLMDDAMILLCGHSYGSVGMQHVLRMKHCYKCQQPISEDKMLPNLVLRAAVRAFRQEQEFQTPQPTKRKWDRSGQAKFDYGYPLLADPSKSKRVHQLPVAVSDTVIIKGNKRTPPHLTGRIGIVTEQCSNGWYVVKTMDTMESFKLQCRSLAKVGDGPASA
ncbi:U-box domain-containing protein 62-like isoform X2 [Wolffia australiana]